ncbi:MAG TPA: hypothetical protein V6D43_08000 [Candidatus Sericytochromatia bacterium]|jgi:hypothetical protein
MKRLKKVTAGLLLAFGIPFSILAVTKLLNPQTKPKDKGGAMAALMVFTLPATAIGGWLAWGSYKEGKNENSERLKSTFFRLLLEGNGCITVLQFARETKLSGEEARQFLDEKAKEFNATFDTDDKGGISYYFNP